MIEKSKKLIYVMLSGGVDSSVALAFLIQQLGTKNYNFKGIYIKCWSKNQLKELKLSDKYYNCTWEDDYRDAQIVCQKLDVEFEIWDLEKEYRQNVVEYTLDGYSKGITPNPDVFCNSTIKFGVFAKKAIEQKANYLVTGHYAGIKEFEGIKLITKSKHLAKDQSYFLWKINSNLLDKIIFPISEFGNKEEVRNFALQHKLLTANKKDSQGLCFIGKTPLKYLLLELFGKKEGKIIDSQGNILGRHSGAFLYTIGQREGLGLSGGPYYVYQTDIKNNLVIVCKKEDINEFLYSKSVIINNINNFLGLERIQYLQKKVVFSACVRYHQPVQDITIEFFSLNKWKINFNEPIKSATPGQSLVIYYKEYLLAGGIIESVS